MKDLRFWVLLLAAAAFLVFVWPTPFEYRSEDTGLLISGKDRHVQTVRYNRFTGQRVR